MVHVAFFCIISIFNSGTVPQIEKVQYRDEKVVLEKNVSQSRRLRPYQPDHTKKKWVFTWPSRNVASDSSNSAGKNSSSAGKNSSNSAGKNSSNSAGKNSSSAGKNSSNSAGKNSSSAGKNSSSKRKLSGNSSSSNPQSQRQKQKEVQRFQLRKQKHDQDQREAMQSVRQQVDEENRKEHFRQQDEDDAQMADYQAEFESHMRIDDNSVSDTVQGDVHAGTLLREMRNIRSQIRQPTTSSPNTKRAMALLQKDTAALQKEMVQSHTHAHLEIV